MRKSAGTAFAAVPLLTLLTAVAQIPAAKTPATTSQIAQPQAIKPGTSAPTPAHSLDQADLTAFFDGILPLQMERSDIAGASVLVMKDGNVLLQKGYGYADVKSKKPVDPASTIFRLASISKLFTWVSVMQLEEQGKLNLDADVNQYLDFPIRPAFNKPVTLRNLMTHTAGFEETINEIIITNPKQAVSLRDFLIANQPMRIYPPGEIPAYSNYGVGLASYIVQRTSGEPFEQYVQEHIFGPLGMTHSSFYQPLQKSLSTLPSEGYRSNTTKPPVGFEIFNPVGAGGVSSSAADMGRFGQALLNGGELDGKRILKSETLASMWMPQFRASDQLPAICMGFYQNWRNHLRWIGHEGDLIAFHSLFFVEPTQKIVLFVSFNSAGGGSEPRPEIINFFSDRYFPGAPDAQHLKTPAKDLKSIEGTFQSTRRDDTTKLKLSTLFSQRSASVDKDAVLTIEGAKDLRGHPVKWKAIGKDLWQADGDQQRIVAIRDAHDKVVRLAVDFPGVQLQRVPWYENETWVIVALCSSLGILVLVVLASLIRTWRRLFQRRRPRPEPQPGTIWLTATPRVAAFIWILFLGTLLGYFLVKGDDIMPPTPAWFKWFVLENFVTMLAIVISTLAVVAGIDAWSRNIRVITKLKFTFVALACAFLSWFAIHWHIIGPTNRI
jgi:CubicO group peptidase (beta-lactamase class C family)/cytochrome b561